MAFYKRKSEKFSLDSFHEASEKSSQIPKHSCLPFNCLKGPRTKLLKFGRVEHKTPPASVARAESELTPGGKLLEADFHSDFAKLLCKEQNAKSQEDIDMDEPGNFCFTYFIIHGEEPIDKELVGKLENFLREFKFKGRSMLDHDLGSNILDDWESSLDKADMIFLLVSPAYSNVRGQKMLIYQAEEYFSDKLYPLKPSEDLLVKYHNLGYHRWAEYLYFEEKLFFDLTSCQEFVEKRQFIKLGGPATEYELARAILRAMNQRLQNEGSKFIRDLVRARTLSVLRDLSSCALFKGHLSSL